MRLLADENFPLPTIEALRHAGHDVTWARTDHPAPRMPRFWNSRNRIEESW